METSKFVFIVLIKSEEKNSIVKSSSTSQEIITKVIRGNYPALPNIFLPVVDVRDVADAHLKGITKYPPPGKYILVEGKLWVILLFQKIKYFCLISKI